MNKSPHLAIARSFHRIKENSIILENRRDVHDSFKLNRRVHYDIKEIGINVVYSQKVSKYLNLKQEETKHNCIYIYIYCVSILIILQWMELFYIQRWGY